MYRVLFYLCICITLTFADKVWNINQKGLKAYKNSDYEGALELFDDALKESPHNRQLTYNRALALIKLNRIAEAKEAFDLVSFEKSDSLTSEVYYHRGLVSQIIADSLFAELKKKNKNRGLEGVDPSQLQGDPQMLQKLLEQQRIQQGGAPTQEKQLTADSVKSVYENALRNYTLALDKNRKHSGALKNRELSARSLAQVPDDEKQENPDQQNKDQQDQNKDQQDQNKDQQDQNKDQQDQNKDQQDQNKDQQDQNKDQQDQNKDQQDQNKDQQDQNKDQQDQNKDQQDQNKDQQEQNKDQQEQNKDQQEQNKDQQEQNKDQQEQPQPQQQEQDSLDREKQEALQMLMQFADDAGLNKPQIDIGPAVPQNGKDW